MIDYDNLKHHPISEKVVNAICSKVGTDEKAFFRVHVSYYLCVVASMMRTMYQVPGNDPEPVSMFAVNLAPSGFGKGHSTAIIENNVIDQFQSNYLEQTFPLLAEINIPKLSLKRAHKKQEDPDVELERCRKEFNAQGPMVFSFDSATPPAVKQLRTKLLMADAGSMNLQTDEIGSNLMSNKDVMILFLELFNGTVKNKLVKNTTEAIRSEDIKGITPTNMMLFGVPSGLLDGGKVEEEFTNMLSQGYARRCFFGFVSEDHQEALKLLTPQERLDLHKQGDSNAALLDVANLLGMISDQINAHQTLVVPDSTALLYFQYQNDCAQRAHQLKDHETLPRTELKQRFYKAMKLAGAYAFIDQSATITESHLEAAIKIAEESGSSFNKILNRDRAYVRLAKYMAKISEEVTQADLIEDLPFYRGTKSVRDDIVTQAIAWGYKNNIVIKKRYTDGIEFLRGETLIPTDLENIILSYSNDITENYSSETAPWDDLHILTQAKGMHWTNHHLSNGYRHDDFCTPGFNMIVIDVDNGVTLNMAKELLDGYKAMFYTTKRHTNNENRFRILIPTNYLLKLDGDDFKEFMSNVFNWLPFESDTQTGQRSRKWLSHTGQYEYTDGQLLDVLPFIPKTTKNEDLRAQFVELQSLDNMERWVISNTGDGNRNNQLLRYAYVLLEGGFSFPEIQAKVFMLNDKLADKLKETEILSTVLKTVGKAFNDKNQAA